METLELRTGANMDKTQTKVTSHFCPKGTNQKFKFGQRLKIDQKSKLPVFCHFCIYKKTAV